MLSLHALMQRIRNNGAGQVKSRKLSAYLVYAAGEIVLIVTGILVAITLNNWNETRKQQDQFYTTIGRIYQSVEEAQEAVRLRLLLYQRQLDLIDQLYHDPDSVPDRDLVYRLFNLDNPLYPTDPAMFRSFQYQSSLLAIDSGNPKQVEIASRMAVYLQRAIWNDESQVGTGELAPIIGPILTANGIPRPNVFFGWGEYHRFDEDLPVLDAGHLRLARQLLASEEMRTALRVLRSRKVADRDTVDNDRENTEEVLNLIKAHYPEIRSHYVDIGIIGSALPGGWEKSVPLQRLAGEENAWQADIDLGPGAVKFREGNSWAKNWGGVGFPAGETYYYGEDIVVEPGMYRVTLDLDEKRYRFELLQ